MKTNLHISQSALKLFVASQTALASHRVWSATPTDISGSDDNMVAPVRVTDMI